MTKNVFEHEFSTHIFNEDGSTTILFDREAYFKDRCHKATGRKIKLIEAAERLKEILKGADQLDKWNGFGSGYVYVREDIEELANLIMDRINE